MIRFILVCAVLLAPAVPCLAANPDEFLDVSLINPNGSVLIPGRLYVPVNYDPSRSYPIVLFLHGYGEQGTNNISQVNNNINNLLAVVKQREAFLLAPQSSNGLWAEGGTVNIRPQMANAILMLDTILAAYNIDPRRQYVTGLSSGGSGTWEAASKFPGRFAAAVPIAADWIRQQPLSGILANMPVWAYHARNDTANEIRYTREIVNNILVANGYHKVAFPLDEPDGKDYYDGSPYYTDGSTFLEYNLLRYTEYASGGHVIWGRVYNETPMYDWMFSQSLPENPVNQPHLDYTASDLGGGLMGYAFKIRNNDGQSQSYALTVAFEAMDTATIHQMKAFGAVRVDREEDATNYSAMPTANYVKAEDTWVFSPFSNNGIPGVSPIDGTVFTGFVEGPGDAYYMLSAGSGSGSQLGDNVSAVYVVCDGNVSWAGVLARAGTSYAVSGVTETVVVLIPGDYNGDGYVDLADYTIWADNYGQTGSNVPGDGNNDGVVDLADYTVWADHYGQGTPPAMTAGEASSEAVIYGTPVSGGASQGDFNGDGFVDQADYTLWADGDASADANGDGVVDLADYTVWADNL